MAKNIANDKTNFINHKIHTIRMIYMIFEESCSILIIYNFFLHFFKTVIFGCFFLFLAKNTPKLQNLFKNGQPQLFREEIRRFKINFQII